MKLLVATTNPNKLKEVREVLEGWAPHKGVPYEMVTLADVPPVPEPPEAGASFWENARIKALVYSQATGLVTVAEDSGLEIDALGGEPGVYSARFLGPDVAYPDRFAEIYRRLRVDKPQGLSIRTTGGDQPSGVSWSARFVTALAVADGTELIFETEATIEGTIATAPAGDHGFGYDPIFYYPPLAATTAQLTGTQKSTVSHRARAFRNLARFLPSLRP